MPVPFARVGATLVGLALAIVTVGGAPQQPLPPPGAGARSPGAQAPPSMLPGAGLILGRVVDAASGSPVAGALVALSGVSAATGAEMERLSSSANVGLIPVSAAGTITTALTDARGQFVYRNLATGRATLNVSAPGYVPGAYGQRRAGGSFRPLRVEPAPAVAEVEIRLWKASTINGAVLDEAGQPVVEVTVRALRRTTQRGRTRLEIAGQSTTDDRGIYRISSLLPGEYLVTMTSTLTTMPASAAEAYHTGVTSTDPATRATFTELTSTGTSAAAGGMPVGGQLAYMPSDRALPPSVADGQRFAAYQTTFHPAAFTPGGATVVTLGSGDDRQGIDIRIELVPTFTISGRVDGPDGPMANARVRLVPTFAAELASDALFTTTITSTDANGGFTVLGVPPGEFSLRALKAGRPTGSSTVATSVATLADGRVVTLSQTTEEAGPFGGQTAPTLSADANVIVTDRDIASVVLTAHGGATLSGRMEFDGNAQRPTPQQMASASVSLTRFDGQAIIGLPALARFDAQGRFTSMQYPPGSYLLSVTPPGPEWTLKSLMVEGKEAIDRPIQLLTNIDTVIATFIDRPPEISGTVSRGGAQAINATVAIFPADHEAWIASGMVSRRARAIDVAPDGAFELPGLLAGTYLIVAVDSATPIELQSPADIEALARVATPITLADREQKHVTLTIATLR